MIVVRLAGGLGNQMFQYAAALSLARQNDDELAVDTSAFGRGPIRGETPRDLGIGDFGISASVLPTGAVERYRRPLGILSDLQRFTTRKLIRRFYVGWHPEVMRRASDVYLEGYFQDERYFLPIWRQVQDEFRLTPALAAEIASISDEIADLPGVPVSLHVRRGDYVSNPKTASVYDVCTPDYYRRAIAHLQDRHGDLSLVLFSDDMSWVLENIPEARTGLVISGRTTRTGNPLRPAQEIALTASCTHHIISNSTFSWWGAYLNPDEGKQVIGPARWTKGSRLSYDGILPQGWIRL